MALDLCERALVWRLVGAPADKRRAVAGADTSKGSIRDIMTGLKELLADAHVATWLEDCANRRA